MPRDQRSESLRLFVARCEFTPTCWEWKGYITVDGYGKFGSHTAHRWAYTRFVGPVPYALTLDHLCRVRNCVNPHHLEPVTLAENCARGQRATRTHCNYGHEFTEANTYQQKCRSDARICRQCSALRAQRIRNRKEMHR